MIPAPYVRRGALTIEAYEAMKAEDEAHLKAEGELPLEAMHRNELVTKATELGIEVTSQASEEALRTAITSKDSTPEVKLENVDEVPADEPADEALAAPKVAKKKKK